MEPFLLQTIGDAFLDEDYWLDPATVGYVPPITADQALACYGQVEAWLSRAARARGNSDYELDVAVPADLPPWRRAMPPAPWRTSRRCWRLCAQPARMARRP